MSFVRTSRGALISNLLSNSDLEQVSLTHKQDMPNAFNLVYFILDVYCYVYVARVPNETTSVESIALSLSRCK